VVFSPPATFVPALSGNYPTSGIVIETITIVTALKIFPQAVASSNFAKKIIDL